MIKERKWPIWNSQEDTPRPPRAKYAEEIIGVRSWGDFRTAFDLIDKGLRKVLFRSCNSAGKTTALSALITYEMEHHDDVKVIISGATATQLSNSLWPAVKRAARRAELASPEDLKKKHWEQGDKRAFLVNPAKAESGQGYHATRVVIIIDEATRFDEETMAALMSNAGTSNYLIVVTYNPIKTDAAVAHIESKAIQFDDIRDNEGLQNKAILCDDWMCFGIDAFQHPNVIEGREVIPGAVTRETVVSLLEITSVTCASNYPDAILIPWLTNANGNPLAYIPTPEALARVRGQWSEAQSSGFIPGSVVVQSWSVDPIPGMRVLAADIGAEGDDPTVWTVFIGNEQIEFDSVKTGEFQVVAAKIDEAAQRHNVDVVIVDDTGVGHGVTDRLMYDSTKPYAIIPVHFGSKPKGFERIRKPQNARCEMYLCLERELRMQKLRLLYDKEAQKELCSQKIVPAKNSETIRLEDKSLIKKRLGRSPNKADAIALARYAPKIIKYNNQPRLL